MAQRLTGVTLRGWLLALAIAAGAGAEGLHLEVDAPGSEARHTLPVDWMEVRGATWTGESPYLDVMIAIDLSQSTLVASGSDIDGDGRTGRISLWGYDYFASGGFVSRFVRSRELSSDPDDTVAHAEFAAAERFVASANPERTRVGFLSFASDVKIHAPIGSSAETVAAGLRELRQLEKRRFRNLTRGGTNTGMAVITGGHHLLSAADEGKPRRRALLVLSDGLPSRPKARGPRFAAAATKAIVDRGVGVHYFPLGQVAVRNRTFFEFLDEFAGSGHTAVGQSGEVVEKLAEVGLDEIKSLGVANRTLNAPGRALRLFADGSFDAVVPLRAGNNGIVFRAETNDGEVVEVVRQVFHGPEPAYTPEAAERQSAAMAAFLERLQERSAETELLVEVEAAHERALEHAREIRIEPAGS